MQVVHICSLTIGKAIQLYLARGVEGYLALPIPGWHLTLIIVLKTRQHYNEIACTDYENCSSHSSFGFSMVTSFLHIKCHHRYDTWFFR